MGGLGVFTIFISSEQGFLGSAAVGLAAAKEVDVLAIAFACRRSAGGLARRLTFYGCHRTW
jgi:hypothetical protein